MAAVPHRAIKEDTFQSQVLIFNSAFESTADPQVLHMTSQIQWVQLHHYFHAPAQMESPTMGSALSTGRATFQNRATCESQIQGINCHGDHFWVHRAHAWNINLQLSWYKRPRNRRELSFCWELQSFHQSHWKSKFLSCQRTQATFYHAPLHLPCFLLQWLWQAQKWQASGVWLGGVYHNSIKQ